MYFRIKYGEHHCKKFIDYFLEYKKCNGWEGVVVDPRTVPRGVLLKRQSAPARIVGTEAKCQGNQGRSRGQPFQVHQPAIPVASHSIRQVSRPLTPIITNVVEDEDDYDYDYDYDYDSGDDYDYERYPTPTAQVTKNIFTSPQVIDNSLAHQDTLPRGSPLGTRPSTPFPHESTPSPSSTPSFGSRPNKVSLSFALPPGAGFFSEVSISSELPAPLYVPGKDKALPTDPSIFVVGDDGDEDWENDDNSNEDDDIGGVRVFTPSPPPKYNSNNLPAGLRVPELAHLAQGQEPQAIRRYSFPEIQQPTPRTPRNKKPVVRNVESVSDTSVVKKLTKVAKDLLIPNIEYIDYDGKWVAEKI
ncbi:hypothetical protein F4782DRAFT_516279 [Xylaria castorea]|nr:hypothetical protein F4782DRAFT_516279 [Xylaria castorea]